MANRYSCTLSLLLLLHLFSRQAFAKSPSDARLSFTENKGQITNQNGEIRDDIDFKINAGPGLNVFIGKGDLHYQWSGKKNDPIVSGPVLYRMDVTLLGSNTEAKVTVDRKLPFREYHYLPAVADRITVNAYEKITYHEVYPHIDWVIYFDHGKLEHDFIIRSGGKASDIKIQYLGTDRISLTKDGALNAVTPMGEITENAPVAYEQSGNKKIAAAFSLNDKILSFTVAPHQGTLVIDPVVDWGSYYGDTEYDDLSDVVLAKDGFVYATGSTNSLSNIATTGAYATTFAGGSNFAGSDAFLTKSNSEGTLIWSTYYGGTANDIGKNIAIDTGGDIYLAGYTNSTTGIATTGAFQTTKLGSTSRTDAYLVKFDTAGQRIWGTYFGGTQNESNTAMSLCTDRNGHLYLTGNTNSTSGVATTAAYQTTFAGGTDIFLAQFSSAGALNWCTYYGGAGYESPYALSNDTIGNIYVAGSTTGSPGGIATTGTFQSNYNASNGEDAFLAKFSPSGALLWGTYFGSTAIDRAYAITTDNSGNPYIAGVTLSASNIATAGTHQTAFGGTEDGFIAKFNASGMREWATYHGGSLGDGISALTYTPNDALYFTGYTTSSDGISTAGGMQPAFGGIQDAYIGRINLTGDTLQWASYIGGIDDDSGLGLDADGTGNVVICGRTVSASGISTTGAHQTTFGGGDADGFLIRIKDCPIPQINNQIDGNISVCAGSTHSYVIGASNATTYAWVMENGWTGTSQTGTLALTFGGNSGTLKVIATNDCYHSDTISLAIVVNALPTTPLITKVGNEIRTTQVFAAYQWYLNGIAIPGATGQTCVLTTTGDYTVTVFNEAGCSNSSVNYSYTETYIQEGLAQNGMVVYPNPVSSHLFLELSVESKITILDITGKVLYSGIHPSGLNSIEMQQYSPGLYLIRLSDRKGSFVGSAKITKQ